MKKRVGFLGYGSLGQYLVDKVEKSNDFELEFIWNRSPEKLRLIQANKILHNFNDIPNRSVDLIVEVSHPSITISNAELFLAKADYFVGSPTAFGDPAVLKRINSAAIKNNHVVYVPSGAFWGGDDIKKMADNDTLTALTVTMQKHPSSFRLLSPLKEKLEIVSDEPVLLYEGPVRDLCSLAPNNVNTMAAACISGHNLGFDKVVGRLYADRSLRDWHIVEIEIKGKNGFEVNVSRKNPSPSGAVTGIATYESFWSSLKNAHGKSPGINLC